MNTSESRGTENSTEISVAEDYSLDEDNYSKQITNGSCTNIELRHSVGIFCLEFMKST